MIELVEGPTPCAGVSATWCPNCGDCACPRSDYDGSFPDGQCDPACPLHAPKSIHAEPVEAGGYGVEP